MTCSTLLRVSGRTTSGMARARDTVATETPAAAATSLMLERRGGLFLPPGRGDLVFIGGPTVIWQYLLAPDSSSSRGGGRIEGHLFPMGVSSLEASFRGLEST